MRAPCAILAAALALAACGDDATSPDAGADIFIAPPMTPAELQAALVRVVCEFDVRCGYVGASEAAACEADAAQARAAPAAWTAWDAFAAGRVGFDAQAANDCVQAWRAAGCSLDQQLAVGRTCAAAFPPAVAIDGFCRASAECTGGWCKRVRLTDGCSGACVAFVPTGGACGTGTSCAPTDYCHPTNKVCAARGQLGAACTSIKRCAQGLVCRGNVSTGGVEQDGVCGERGKVGQPCSSALRGTSDCDPALECDTSLPQPVCIERLAAGASCGTWFSCRAGLACVGLATDTSGNVTQRGHCAPFADVGLACVPDVDVLGCPYDQVCVADTSTCATRGTLGSDCSTAGSDGFCRINLYCDNTEHCAPLAALGEACTPPVGFSENPCRDGVCDATTKVCTLVCT